MKLINVTPRDQLPLDATGKRRGAGLVRRADDRRLRPHSPERMAAIAEGIRNGELRRAAVRAGRMTSAEAWAAYPPGRQR